KKMVPHGGDGGRGGNVIIRSSDAAPQLSSFRFKSRWIAESGGNGGSNRKRGKNGKDLIVLVPLGTRIFDRKRNLLIRDLTTKDEEVIVLEGGAGGVGNHSGKEATRGAKGASLELELRLHLMADFYLIGLPNSGKSTLLNRLTRAHIPEKAYPFATPSPKLGVCNLSDYEKATLCELPSLYKSSHDGRGRGTDFLKHIEGAKMIFFVLDPLSEFSDTLEEGLTILRKETEIYNKKFLDIPYAVIVNKIDLPEAKERIRKSTFRPGVPCFYLSAKNGEGLEDFISLMKERMEFTRHA
ncbi:MAG: 50S ribosome-binding GTPase, partial [Candidatus Omnitrophica bacterium]|nr:50S ribosome-binding GTPase [Candidatus Omnitrophota bacterium]